MITLAGFKPYINSLKDKRQSRSSIVPNVLFFMKFQYPIRSARGRNSHKKRLSIWCSYYWNNGEDKSLPKNVMTPRIRKVLEHRKIVNNARRKFTGHANKIKYANRRAEISRLEESQCYSSESIKFSFETLEDWWNFRGAPQFWYGGTKTVDYYRRGFVIVPWLEENVGPIIEPVLSSRILYGDGWMLDFSERSLSFSEKISGKMSLLFVLRWI
jgi:hypothetical protein